METGVLDTGNWSDSETGGVAETGVLDTGKWTGVDTESETESETGEPPDSCEVDEAFVRWDSTSLNAKTLGVDQTFIGVGDCSVSVDDLPGDEVVLGLDCTLDGARDGETFEGEFLELELLLETNVQLPIFEPSVTAQVHIGGTDVESVGDRYVVLSQPMLPNDANAPVLIATQGSRTTPFGFQVEPYFTSNWYGSLGFEPGDVSCETGDAPSCGFYVAIAASGGLGVLPIEVAGGQVGSFVESTETVSYDLYVETAWQAPDALECGEDFPSSLYAFVTLGLTP